MAELRRAVWLYRRSLGAHLRSTLEYEADFWIMSVAAVLTQGVGVIFLWAIFRTIPEINGWQFWDVVLIYSLVVLSEGIAVLFGQGIWSLAMVVNLGGFDALLVRPFSPLLQVLSSQVGMNGLGNVALGGGLLVGAVVHVDVDWSPGIIALGVVLLVSAPLVKVGLNVLTNCAAFWLRTPWSMFAFSMHTFRRARPLPDHHLRPARPARAHPGASVRLHELLPRRRRPVDGHRRLGRPAHAARRRLLPRPRRTHVPRRRRAVRELRALTDPGDPRDLARAVSPGDPR